MTDELILPAGEPILPREKHAAVLRGLREAFGVSLIEDIRRITKGLSSDLVVRIVVAGSPYLLRVIERINEISDPVRHFACMESAAAAHLAPRVHYASREDGICITDFIENQPLTAARALLLLPPALRRLHALPPFPKAFNYLTAHKVFIWRFRSAKGISAEETEQAFSAYDKVCAVYPRCDSDIVSCHMDLKPENILFDGESIWLADWQAAFLNDRYFDLAIIANFLISSDEDEWACLERYFGRAPSLYEQARFFLMRQITHMFYAAVLLLLGSKGEPIPPPETIPSFEDFHRRISDGAIDLADDATKIVYGHVHWRRLLKNIRQPRFNDSLARVAERNTNIAERNTNIGERNAHSEGLDLLLPSPPPSHKSDHSPSVSDQPGPQPAI